MSRYIWAFVAIGLVIGMAVGFALLRPNHHERAKTNPTETSQPEDQPASEVRYSKNTGAATAGG